MFLHHLDYIQLTIHIPGSMTYKAHGQDDDNQDDETHSSRNSNDDRHRNIVCVVLIYDTSHCCAEHCCGAN